MPAEGFYYRAPYRVGPFDEDDDKLRYSSANDIYMLLGGCVERLRKDFRNNSAGAALKIKQLLNKNGLRAEMLTFSNGHGSKPLCVSGEISAHHSVVLLGECIVDVLSSDSLCSTSAYVEQLEKDNSELCIDRTQTTGWYDENGFGYVPTLRNLKSLKPADDYFQLRRT